MSQNNENNTLKVKPEVYEIMESDNEQIKQLEDENTNLKKVFDELWRVFRKMDDKILDSLLPSTSRMNLGNYMLRLYKIFEKVGFDASTIVKDPIPNLRIDYDKVIYNGKESKIYLEGNKIGEYQGIFLAIGDNSFQPQALVKFHYVDKNDKIKKK